MEFDYQELVKATEEFSPSRLIGKGSHGSVYRGRLLQMQDVAIKKSSGVADNDERNDSFKKLENEICVLSLLLDPRSPYIINFIGTSNDHGGKKGKLLVMDFMPNGSLYELLHAAATPPSWSKRVEIAIQIARAVQFLHEGKPVIIHRDIKSANILFDENWNAKLADFGLAVSVFNSSAVHQTSQPAGTIGYIDPCYSTPRKLSTKIDVFSYGVVLLEIITCRKVIDVSKFPASIVEWAIPLIEKQRLAEICDARIALPAFMEGSTIRHLLNVAARCVSSEEETRPSMSEIVTGMDQDYRLVQRIGRTLSSSWTSLVRNMMQMRRLRKLSKAKCAAAEQFDHVRSDLFKWKLLLREILTDTAPK